jgi:hypothetical protein
VIHDTRTHASVSVAALCGRNSRVSGDGSEDMSVESLWCDSSLSEIWRSVFCVSGIGRDRICRPWTDTLLIMSWFKCGRSVSHNSVHVSASRGSMYAGA